MTNYDMLLAIHNQMEYYSNILNYIKNKYLCKYVFFFPFRMFDILHGYLKLQYFK